MNNNKYLDEPFPYNIYAEATEDAEAKDREWFMSNYNNPSDSMFRQTFWYIVYSCNVSRFQAGREVEIITLRYKYGATLTEIGEKFDMTRECVRQIIARFLCEFKNKDNLEILRYEDGLRGWHRNKRETASNLASLKSKEALLCELRLLLANDDCSLDTIRKYVQGSVYDSNPYIGMTLEEFNQVFPMSIRTYNSISRYFVSTTSRRTQSPEALVKLGVNGRQGESGVVTMRDIISTPEEEIRRIRSLGEKSFFEFKNILASAGLSLKETPERG